MYLAQPLGHVRLLPSEHVLMGFIIGVSFCQLVRGHVPQDSVAPVITSVLPDLGNIAFSFRHASSLLGQRQLNASGAENLTE